MELSKTIGSMAVVLGVVVAAGFAVGEDNIPAPTPKATLEHFERVCSRPQKTDMDREACRAAYKALSL